MSASLNRGYIIPFYILYYLENLMLRVRDFNGFHPLSSVDLDYTRDTESYSVYSNEHQVCRISHGASRWEYTVEVFDAGLFAEHLECIAHVLTLYAEH